MGEHRPVLCDAALEGLAVRPDGLYVDATYGRGGHAAAILERLGPEGRLWVLDRDPEAVAAAREQLGGDARVTIVADSFAHLGKHLRAAGLHGAVDGILLDLGVSSPQLDRAERGFSFRHDGPLDMRMDPDQGEDAASWLAGVEEKELVRVLRDYGEERFARRIARAIVAARAEEPIATTGRLATIVAGAVPRREPGRDPATRTFQALRIAVNDELGELERVLPVALEALARGGRLAVISFHSLEDRRVKRFMRDEARGDAPPDMPLREDQIRRRLTLVGGARRAGESEVAENPRARSAVLRVAERRD
ncbi:16S rRNA (cytosine(1402)-N(4))-methyltransferase RsmH [Thiohalospira sp.]|uniref:16S rRNA (cytosine(1402)-N(4))-methyltransferase RsmH n=1 Tax=Thiohalospira sp. TaxID=3080549 RepID=UPI0039815FAB